MHIQLPSDSDRLLAPVWSGDTVYEESFLPVEPAGQNGGDLRIPLLYAPAEILSVTDLTREHTYEAGRDYRLENGQLVIGEDSRIRRLPWEKYQVFGQDDAYPFACAGGGRLFFSEGDVLHRMEYCITYRHTDRWNGFVPLKEAEILPRTRGLLQNGRPLCFCFFGDSITTGANASGCIEAPPFLPSFPCLTAGALEQKYRSDITYLNHAVGGTRSGWGCERLPLAFAGVRPDLMFLGFGMNDASGRVAPQTFCDNIRTMMEETLALSPDCEFLLCSTTLPNPLAPGFVSDHEAHEPLLSALCREYGSRAALVPMTSVHKALLARKRFYDMTGNNINHANDFLSRVYAQTILAKVLP